MKNNNHRKGYLWEQMALFGQPEVVGFGSVDFKVKEIEKAKSKKMIIDNHYSHKVCNDAHTHIHLGCFYKGELIGCLQFGYAMNPQSMDSVVSGTKINEYKELNRMWFCDNAPPNTASRAISYSIKYIKRKYPNVKWIQSFADERCKKFGIVYQAANFKYYGEHKNIMWEVDGEVYHNSIVTNNNRNKKKELEAKKWKERAVKIESRQFRYIYFIDKRYEKKCCFDRQQYPKHYTAKAVLDWNSEQGKGEI